MPISTPKSFKKSAATQLIILPQIIANKISMIFMFFKNSTKNGTAKVFRAKPLTEQLTFASISSMAGATWHFGEDFIADLKNMFEAVNVKKDQLVLDAIIKPYWPESITPNHLTLVRIVIGAALFILLFNFRIESGLIVLPLFFIGILTDLLDGVIARGMDKETALGIFLDPVADRILLVPIAIYSLLGPSALLLVAFLFFEV